MLKNKILLLLYLGIISFANDKLDSLKQTIKTGVNPEEDLPVQVQEVEKETTNG